MMTFWAKNRQPVTPALGNVQIKWVLHIFVFKLEGQRDRQVFNVAYYDGRIKMPTEYTDLRFI